MTVDSPELNITMPAESISPRQTNEIIIAVPTVSSATERKSAAVAKKAAIISFDEDENSSAFNNNVLKCSTPSKTVSLSDACLKYQEKQKLANEKSKPFITDSTYERLHAEPIDISKTVRPNETVYIEPESPTVIKMMNPVTQTYPSLSSSFDYKEQDSKATDSSSFSSNATTHSSTSPQNHVASEPSHSTSMNSSISSEHNLQNSPNVASSSEIGNENDNEEDENANEIPFIESKIGHDNNKQNNNDTDTDYIARIQELTANQNQNLSRIRELEERCIHLQDRVSALTL